VSESHQQKGNNLPADWQRRASGRIKEYKQILERADKRKMLKQLPALHEEAFATTDCLTCAACCKNFSPRFKTPDIKRISKVMGMKEGAFIEKYLRIDEDGDYVLQSTPCSFLGEDNRCSIYEDRPSDCARFPYTDEDVIIRRIPLTLKNVTFCPIVYKVLEGVRKVQ
jgi:Fe-S-cluster containining protein